MGRKKTKTGVSSACLSPAERAFPQVVCGPTSETQSLEELQSYSLFAVPRVFPLQLRNVA